MDEPVEDSMTSSIVDHVFFVLQKCSHRALLSCNVNALLATVNLLITVLTRDYKEVHFSVLLCSNGMSAGIAEIIYRSIEQKQHAESIG